MKSDSYLNTHYLLKKNRDFYQNLSTNKQGANWNLIIMPDDDVTGYITIFNKRRDKVQFLIGRSLTFDRIIIDSLDSIIPTSEDTSNCL